MLRNSLSALLLIALAGCLAPTREAIPPGSCTATTCAALGKNCGSVSDGCGATLACGTCTMGLTCGGGGTQNVCGGTCIPTTCQAAGKDCGTMPDGCGTTLTCGPCDTGMSCGGGGSANVCGAGSCNPTTCRIAGDNCGTISDGCSTTLDCGTCGTGQTCGLTTPNVCSGTSCTATTCIDAHAECGAPSNGCGGTLNCGTCASPLTCGGGGTQFVCGGQCAPVCPNGYGCDTTDASCIGGTPTQLVLDVKAIQVAGAVTLNGAIPDSTQCSYQSQGATVNFSDSAQGYSFTLAATCPTSGPWVFSGLIYPGTYDVTVSGYASVLPEVPFKVATALSIQADTSNLIYDVKTYQVSGTVSLNGATPDSSQCSYQSQGATIAFTDKTAGHSFSLAVSCPTSGSWVFSGLVYPGTYAVTISGYASIVPSTPFTVATALSIQANIAHLNYNVQTYEVSGSVTLNGATPDATQCSYQSQGATATFTDKTAGISFTLAVSCPPSGPWVFVGLVYAGTYDVTIAGYASILPEVAQKVASGLVLRANAPGLNYDVSTFQLAGTVTLNGARPDSSQCSYQSEGATATFADKTSGYSFTLPVTCPTSGPWAFNGLVYPGTYDVTITGYASVLPGVPFKVATGLSIQGNAGNLLYDVKTVQVSGAVTLNGNTPDSSQCSYQSQGATVTFTDTTAGTYFSLPVACPTSGAWTFSGLVYSGTYNVVVTGYASILPEVPFVVATALPIHASTAHLSYDVKTYDVAGSVTLNGTTPESSDCSYQSQGAIVSFTDAAHGYSFSVAATCPSSGPWAFSGLVYAGTYKVTVSGYASVLPNVPEVVISRLQIP